MTEDRSPEIELMMALGPEVAGGRNNVKKTSVRDAMIDTGTRTLFERNASFALIHQDAFSRILRITFSSILAYSVLRTGSAM